MNKAKVIVKNMNINKANGKNSNGNDENVGGIDHESNRSNGNKTEARKNSNSNKANGKKGKRNKTKARRYGNVNNVNGKNNSSGKY